jgi:hypothetical protein
MVTGAGANDSFSGNYMTHFSRNGIELQYNATNLKVNDNYMSDFTQSAPTADSHLGISEASPAITVEIGRNVIIDDGPGAGVTLFYKSAIEVAGTGLNVHDNFVWGWGAMILDCASGPFTATNNIAYASALVADDDCPNIVQPAQSSDQLFGATAPATYPSPPAL